MIVRLDKMLAHLGYGSRKEVKLLIRKGEVIVNDTIIYDDDFKVDSDLDEVIVYDEEVTYSEFVYIMLNKPQDYVSATYDNKYKTVIDLVSDYASYKIFPVGRLDIDSVGLLLITNDGKLCHQLLSPKSHVDKKYYVEFSGDFIDSYYKNFEKGIKLDDGYVTMPSKVELIEKDKAYITIHEGKFHQVKRMFEALNMKVTYLKRVTFGSLILDDNLKEGEYRLLSEDEILKLKENGNR